MQTNPGVFSVETTLNIAQQQQPRKLVVSKASVGFVALSLCLFSALNYGYISLVHPAFEYAGMILDVNIDKLLAAYLIVFVTAVCICYSSYEASTLGIFVLASFVYFPLLSFWALTDQSGDIVWIATLSLSVIYLVSQINCERYDISRPRDAHLYLIAFFLVIGGYVFIELITSGLASNFNLGLDNVYERREFVYADAVGSLGGYLLPWFTKILNPIFFVLAYLSRRYTLAVGFLGIQVLIFGLTGYKEQLLFPFVALMIALSARLGWDVKLRFVGVMAAVLLLGILLETFESARQFFAAFVSRSFFSVPLNHFEYFEFFQFNPHTIWSNSVMSGLFDYPYNAPIPVIIGTDRWGDGSEAFANTGYIASGYMHWGIAGVVIYSAVIGIILKLFDLLRTESNKPIVLAVTALGIFQLVNGDLPAAILTHGIFVALLVGFLSDKKVEG